MAEPIRIKTQYYRFYRSQLKEISQAIEKRKSLVFVGINSIGKTLLVNQVLSSRFRKEFLKEKKAKLIFLEFKDKFPPTSQQLYWYWLEKQPKHSITSLIREKSITIFLFTTIWARWQNG